MATSRFAVLDAVAPSPPHKAGLIAYPGVAATAVGWYARHLTAVWLACGGVMALLQVAYYRNLMNPDGVAYLDMGDAYLRADWVAALRTHWSPLYAWLIAATVQLVRPPAALEFPLVHLVNLGLFFLAFGAFAYVLRQLRPVLAASGMPVWIPQTLAYAMFLWCTLLYGPLELVTPDLMVAAFVFGISGLVLRLQHRADWRASVLLGLMLGAGYLAKAPLLPLSVVFVAAGAILIRGRTRRIAHTAIIVAGLAAVVLPFVVVLSTAKGRLTAGDSATLNYLWQVDGVTPFYYWQGGPDGVGQPIHRSDLLLERPTVYGFDSPFEVTYAVWYAPDYWYEGATPHFVLSGQLRAVAQALLVYADLAKQLAIPFVGLLVLLALGRPRSRPAVASVALLLPTFAALGMYALVLVEPRYVAPFVILLFVGLLSLVQRPSSSWARWISLVSAAAIGVALLVPLGSATVRHVRGLADEAAQGALLAPDEQARVAEALRAVGVQPGDAVASGDRGLDDGWARLARVRLVAEVADREGTTQLAQDAAARTDVLRALEQPHVRAVVAPNWPGLTGDPEWHPIPGTTYFYRLLPVGS